jgi:uncharacterized protein (TIGR03000 family)
MRPLRYRVLTVALVLTGVWSGTLSCEQGISSPGRMIIIVPAEAAVTINGRPTRSRGTERRFRSDGLLPGKTYTYRIRAEVQREGRTREQTQTVDLQAGQTKTLVFDFSSTPEPRATLKPPAPPSNDLDRRGEVVPAAASLATSSPPPLVAKYLTEGKLAEGEGELMARLRMTPKDSEWRFSLGVVQFLRAVEGLMQDLYRYGLKYDAAMTPFGQASIPFLRLPVPENPTPEPVSYDDIRQTMQTFVSNLWKAEATLAAMDETDVQLKLDFGKMRLDSNGDGAASGEELLWKIFARVNPRMGISNAQSGSFAIAFDRADACWLRGYCHLLMAMGEFVLAHDGRELFERSAFLVFAQPDSPHTFLLEERTNLRRSGESYFVDLIAMVHAIDLPVTEPERMASVLAHMESTIAESRKMWAAIRAEKDNYREWIPGPNQTGVFPSMRVTDTIVQRWHSFLDELEAILKGDKLIPFWRGGAEGEGINLRRVFTEPTDLDLVAWVQGSAATPYLEHGELTDEGVWQRLRTAFGGQMMTFFVWFN